MTQLVHQELGVKLELSVSAVVQKSAVFPKEPIISIFACRHFLIHAVICSSKHKVCLGGGELTCYQEIFS